MSKTHTLFEVACKAFLLDYTRQKVLLVICEDGLLGVPGGHLEAGETPAEAIHRELLEEVGLDLPSLTPLTFSFWPEKNKALLLFAGRLPADANPSIPQPNDDCLQGVRFVALDDLEQPHQNLLPSVYADAWPALRAWAKETQ